MHSRLDNSINYLMHIEEQIEKTHCKIADEFEQTEAFLNRNKSCDLRTWITLATTERIECFLGCDRFANHYRIMLNIVEKDDDGNTRRDQTFTWQQCSRDLRLRAYSALPHLLQEITRKARDELADIAV